MIEQAERLAANVTKKAEDQKVRLQFAWQQVFAREATSEEIENADEYLRLTQNDLESEEKAWSSLCHALLVTNEFRYVD